MGPIEVSFAVNSLNPLESRHLLAVLILHLFLLSTNDFSPFSILASSFDSCKLATVLLLLNL